MTTAPTLTSREVNLAAIATRALLDALLEQADLPFEQWTVLAQLDEAATAGRVVTVDDVVRRQEIDLHRPADAAEAVVPAAVRAGLVAVDGAVVLATDAGRALHEGIQSQVREVVRRVYDGLSTDDLVVARRVIDTVTEQARAELARLR